MTILVGTLIIWALQFSGCPCFSYICQTSPILYLRFMVSHICWIITIPQFDQWIGSPNHLRQNRLLTIKSSSPFRFSENLAWRNTERLDSVPWSSYVEFMAEGSLWSFQWNMNSPLGTHHLWVEAFLGLPNFFYPQIIHISPELIIIYIYILLYHWMCIPVAKRVISAFAVPWNKPSSYWGNVNPGLINP
jgi:hypothetical protein